MSNDSRKSKSLIETLKSKDVIESGESFDE